MDVKYSRVSVFFTLATQITLNLFAWFNYWGWWGLERYHTDTYFILFPLGVIFFDGILILNLVRLITQSGYYKSCFAAYIISTILMIVSFAFLYSSTGVGVEVNGRMYPEYDMRSCIYFSVITWTSLGYGDIFPLEPSRLWVMIEVFFGSLHMGLLIGLATHYFSRKSKI